MPHSGIMLQEGVVVLTPRMLCKTFRIHLCSGLYISVPCREAVTINQQWEKTISSGIEADNLRFLCIDSQAFLVAEGEVIGTEPLYMRYIQSTKLETRNFGKPVTAPVSPFVMQPMSLT
eukprot:665089-Pelagomonas_calceolata.AAC.1